MSMNDIVNGPANGPMVSNTKKQPMEAVNYRGAGDDGHACSNCAYFMGPDQCQLVDGTISASGVCDLWAAKQADSQAIMQQLFNPAMQEGGNAGDTQ